MSTKLHLGCGPRYLPGYTHVDIQAYSHVDVICDITQDMTSFFTPESIDEIYACHVLEHVDRSEVIPTLRRWHSLLRVGGYLRLAVPDFEAIVEVYQHNPLSLYDSLLGLLYGGQRNKWDFHTFTFDLPNITRLLGQIGFTDVARYAWQDFLPPHYDDYSRCYLPHGNMESGRLMSLNITAKKTQTTPDDDVSFLAGISKRSRIKD